MNKTKIVNGVKFNVTEKKTKKQTVQIMREVLSLKKQKAYDDECAAEMRKRQLRQIISDKKLLDMDCTAEQDELKTLLGL